VVEVTAQTLTLADFLAARFDEDEGWAPTRHTLLCLRTGCETCIFGDDEDTIAAERVCTCGYPARVLAECEAKRRIVELMSDEVEYVVYSDDVLRALALPYADHPDFRPEWRT
jgi:hypothetical protein